MLDYYSILDIDKTATQEQIKTAFKKQALKWHPDRNPNVDTTEKMQDINQAYLILKDAEARKRYDLEWNDYIGFQSSENTFDGKQATEDYTIKDEILNNWMNNAKKQSISLAQQTINDLRGMVYEGATAATKAMFGYLAFSFIMLMVFLIAKSCER
jgi:DnaJ-class molecular chaperone